MPIATKQVGDTSAEYTMIVSNQEDQLGLSRSYSDPQVIYSSNHRSKSHPPEREDSVKTRPPRPPPPRRDSTQSSVSSQHSCPLYRDLTPSPSPSSLSEDPPYQTPIDAIKSPNIDVQHDEVQPEVVVRSVSDCPVRLVRVRGSSRRKCKHQPLKRVNGPSPQPPLLKSLSLDCLDYLEDSDDDYDEIEEIYSNPYDSINTTAVGSKPVRVTARLSNSSVGIPRPPSRQSVNSQNTPQPQSSLVSNYEKSRSAECLDRIEQSDDSHATSSLLERRRLRNRHTSLDDSVKRLRAKRGLQKINSEGPRKLSMEIQTYPESPQHLKGVGSQENLFFSESSTSVTATPIIQEESTNHGTPNKKITNGVAMPPKGKNRNKKVPNFKPSRGGLTNLFKKKPKDN